MTETADQQGRRQRDAKVTKAAILDAARLCFTSDSYDEVGVREIAADAGVDPALVIRYFGSKESLFAAAVLTNFGAAEFMAGDPAELAEKIASLIVKKKDHGDFDPMLAIIRSSMSPTTSNLIRDVIDEQVIAPLAARLTGPDAEARAALLMTQVLGLFMGRLFIQNRALVASDSETLVRYLQPVLQVYIDGLSSTAAPAE
jgi:AcrR family transcriptional regulator